MKHEPVAARNETYREGRWRVSSLTALGFVGLAVLLGVNLANRWPMWGLVLLVSAAAGLVYVQFFVPPTVVHLSQRGISYSGGIPNRTEIVPWETIVEIRKKYEPGAFNAGPLLSAATIKAQPATTFTLSRGISGLHTLVERIEARTLSILLPGTIRLVESGSTARFGALTLDRTTGVSGGTLLQKHSISLGDVSGWNVESPKGAAAIAGPLLVVSSSSSKKRVVVPLDDVANLHVLLAALAQFTGVDGSRAAVEQADQADKRPRQGT